MATNATTRIETLQVRGAVPNTPALRLRLSHLLGSADLRPPGFSPAAVLIVRRIADPLPGRVVSGQGGMLSRAWTRAAREALSTLYRQAARPAQGPVSATAEAVLFADHAELLACLARDIIQERARSCWWWRGMLRGAPSTAASMLVGLFCREARALPAVLYRFAQHGEAAPLLAALSPTQAAHVLTAISQAYAIPHIAAVLAASPADGPAAASSTPALPISPHPEPPAHAPWEALLPAALLPRGIQRHHAALLGVALTLAVRPGVARAPAFRRQLAAWWAAGGPASAPEPAAPVDTISARSLPPDGPPPAMAYAARPAEVSAQQTDQTGHPPAPLRPDHAALPPPDHAAAADVRQPPLRPLVPAAAAAHGATRAATEQMPQQPGSTEPPTSPAETSRPARCGAQHDPSANPAAQPAPTPDMPAPTQATPEEPPSTQAPVSLPLMPAPLPASTTDLGGVLFLINMMLHLDLPECFEAGWLLDSQVGPWGVLELLARGMLARHSAAWQADPLWDTLAALDGRPPATRPGEHFNNHPDYQIPPEWLRQPGGQPGATRCFWSSTDERVRLWSAQGFLLYERFLSTPDPAHIARAMLSACLREPDTIELIHAADADAPLAAPGGPLLDGMNPQLYRWLTLVLPFIERRLELALGVEAAQTAEALLLRPGQLFLTHMYLDLVMPMSAVTIPVRLAGLDRDPGWLPPFGRVIRFHFEE